MKHIWIVTLNFNSEQETHQCLASLAQITIPTETKVSILVIDNASKTPMKLNSTEVKNKVILLRNDDNLGFAGGNNVGINYAMNNGADYVMLLNNDTYVDGNFLKELLSILDSDTTIGAVCPKIYFAKGHEYHKDRYKKEDLGRIFWYAGGYTDWANVVSVHRGVDEVDHGQFDATEEISFASGCCMLLKREVLEKTHGFDARYFLYYEDADLNERIKQLGYKIYYVPNSVIWHVSAGSSGIGSKLHDYFLTRNRLLFGFDYAPLRTKFALIRESIRLLFTGRQWQKIGIRDYFLSKFGKGSYR